MEIKKLYNLLNKRNGVIVEWVEDDSFTAFLDNNINDSIVVVEMTEEINKRDELVVFVKYEVIDGKGNTFDVFRDSATGKYDLKNLSERIVYDLHVVR